MFRIEKMDLLVGIYVFCVAVTELMGAKTIPLATIGAFHLTASVAVLVLPVLFSINDVVSEVYGRERVKSLVSVGILVVFLLACFSALAVALPPSARFAASNTAYRQIFQASLRFSVASLTAFLLAECLDVFVFAYLRKRLGVQRLWLRTNVSNILAQGIDTLVFMTMAFWHVGDSISANISFLLGLIIPYWLLKCSLSFLETPFVYAGVRWLRGNS